MRSTTGWSPTTWRRRSRMPRCCTTCGLLAPADLEAIRAGLTEIGAAHARGEWTVTLDLEDGQTALETLLTRADRRGGRAPAPRPLAQRPGARRAAAVPARRRRGARRRRRGVAAALDGTGRRAGRASRCPATRTCSRPCRARSRSGPAASRPSSPTTPTPAPCAPAHRQEPARLRRGLRHADLPVDREGTRTRSTSPRVRNR